jgi:polysaccharide deacetylase family protein (PEP-CTERM system associated)
MRKGEAAVSIPGGVVSDSLNVAEFQAGTAELLYLGMPFPSTMRGTNVVVTSHTSGTESSAPLEPWLIPDGVSVDVEDYFHVEAFADRIPPESWGQYPSRVVANTRRVLELFSRAGARGTFFILGWVAEREPALVREILSAGHEIGCHSYLHRCIFRLTPEQFRADTRRAAAAIENATGRKVLGYRAPTFSVIERSLWAIPILAEEGFLYDSSVFPVRHDVYGMPEAPRFSYQWTCPGGRALYEIPPLTIRVCGQNLPAVGGGYLRILPMWYTRWALRRVRRQDGKPVTVYFHPWEVDPDQPRLAGRWRSRFRHYRNLKRMERRLEEILRGSRFVPLMEVLQNQLAQGPLPARPVAAD